MKDYLINHNNTALNLQLVNLPKEKQFTKLSLYHHAIILIN